MTPSRSRMTGMDALTCETHQTGNARRFPSDVLWDRELQGFIS